MVDEVEVDLEDFAADMDRRRAQAARADVERHMPAVVQPRRQREADLADHLRPAMQGRARVAPGGIVEHGPGRAWWLHGG